jgi:hypothetical protein
MKMMKEGGKKEEHGKGRGRLRSRRSHKNE